MKLEKLRLVREELQDEFYQEDITSSIFYYFNKRWIELDKTSTLSKTVHNNLELSKLEPVALRRKGSKNIWVSCSEIECCIALYFSNSAPKVLEVYRRRINNVVKRASNAYKVSHNQLTQLLARDSFREKLHKALTSISHADLTSEEEQEGNLNKILAVFALDIDHFKQINDTYGHLYGDQVLKTFAIRLERAADNIALELSDNIEISIGHPSGEEFLILVQGYISKDTIIKIANQFRLEISDSPLPSDKEWEDLSKRENLSPIILPQLHERNVTTSVGLAFYALSQEGEITQDEITSILDRADTALYRAKSGGRNQVISFDDILSNCGRVLEHDIAARVIAIDIGKNVGVSIGQEFKVFSTSYSGKKGFMINDGRTSRTIGNYPRIEITTITVFNVQPEVSFAYISDIKEKESSVTIEKGALLELIPTGSIAHLLTGRSKYFPDAMEHIKVGDLSALQNFIDKYATSKNSTFSIVFRFSAEQEYFKRYGSAALNSALARLYREVQAIFPVESIVRILDTSSICVVGFENNYKENSVADLIKELDTQLPELRLVAGIFGQTDVKREEKSNYGKLNIVHSIDFARYAASDYVKRENSKLIRFGHIVAQNILRALFDLKSTTQGIADFEKLSSLGVSSAEFINLGGLLYRAKNNSKHAADLYEIAVKKNPAAITYKTNFGLATYFSSQTDRGLTLLASLTNEELQVALEKYPYGFLGYTALLAKAKISESTLFDAERFSWMAVAAIKLEKYNRHGMIQIIQSALAMQ